MNRFLNLNYRFFLRILYTFLKFLVRLVTYVIRKIFGWKIRNFCSFFFIKTHFVAAFLNFVNIFDICQNGRNFHVGNYVKISVELEIFVTIFLEKYYNISIRFLNFNHRFFKYLILL